MDDALRARANTQLACAIKMGQQVLTGSNGPYPAAQFEQFIAYARAALAAITGKRSDFSTQFEEILRYNDHYTVKVQSVLGVVHAVRACIEEGLLDGFRRLIRGELFSDYLDMAQHLLGEEYKDAAAVIAGASLEAHLRAMCVARGVPTSDDKGGDQVPRKAELLNEELRKHDCYDKATQKLVTAWLGIRNEAAHGHYDKYSDDTVKAMVIGVRGFISQYAV